MFALNTSKLNLQEWQKVNKELFKLLGGYCGKKPEQVMKDATRDLWLNAEEALSYGIIDEIINPVKSKSRK